MLFSLSMWPIDAGERAAQAVADVVDAIDTSGMPYRLTAMSTQIEGEWGPVMQLIGFCRGLMEERYGRTYCAISIDSQPGAPAGQLEHNVAAVERLVGRTLKT